MGTTEVIARQVVEGTVPLIAVEGTPYECGRQYGEIVLERYPGYRRYLDPAYVWYSELSPEMRKLIEKHTPHIPEMYKGLAEVAGPATKPREEWEPTGCTSFGLSGSVTLDGQPISGQTKDTAMRNAYHYVVLRMHIAGAPDILVLAYPGEVMGYGFWSTGMSIFRNTLYSTESASTGLSSFGFLALAAQSVHDVAEVAKKHGVRGAGNLLVSDSHGESLSVEYNAGGVSIIPAKDGIATHGNHCEGRETGQYATYPDENEWENSRYRMHGLWGLFNAERGKLTPQKVFQLVADHSLYPKGVCRHSVAGDGQVGTSASVVCEPTLGRLHVTRGQPCCNWPVTYTI